MVFVFSEKKENENDILKTLVEIVHSCKWLKNKLAVEIDQKNENMILSLR